MIICILSKEKGTCFWYSLQAESCVVPSQEGHVCVSDAWCGHVYSLSDALRALQLLVRSLVLSASAVHLNSLRKKEIMLKDASPVPGRNT